ncbi:MAG: glycosyltransferase family 9 protein [Bdellovibrionales bacterium]
MRDVWMGKPLEGAAVLIRCHHGLGDTIQFVRFCPLVRQRARRIVVKAQEPLCPLLREVGGIDHVVSLHAPDPPYEVDVEIMELAYIERITLANLPAPVPYLFTRRNSPEFKKDERLKVGLTWAVGDFRPERGLPFHALRPILDIPGVRFFSLQRGPPAAQSGGYSFALGPEAPEDLEVTAALIREMDFVVTVDTMVAHLAGALGRPVLILLCHNSDWRWMRERRDSPWYPTARLFRQVHPGNWSVPVTQVRHYLARQVSRLGSSGSMESLNSRGFL